MSSQGQATNSQSKAATYTPMEPAAHPAETAYTLPVSLYPYSFYKLSLIIMIVCFVVNMPSLALGIPAFVLSWKSEEKKQKYQFESAKRYGAIALTLTVINMIYTGASISFLIGLLWGLRALHII